MRRPRPLPARLAARPFTVAEASDAGVHPDRLRARDLDRSVHGARMPLDPSLRERCLALVSVCRADAVVCGPTAAILHRMPVPHRFAMTTSPVHFAVPPAAPAIRRAGVSGRRLDIADQDVTAIEAIPVTTLERTWCDLAAQLSLPELVAAADALLRARRTDMVRLEAAVDRHPDHRRRPRLTTALALVDPASESPMESELRVLVVLAGLPRPEANAEVRDRDGRFVARVGLLFRQYGEVLEYHGDHHRTDLHQWRRDRTREAELESLGLHVMEVTAVDLRDPDALLDRIARNLIRRGWDGKRSVSRRKGASPRG